MQRKSGLSLPAPQVMQIQPYSEITGVCIAKIPANTHNREGGLLKPSLFFSFFPPSKQAELNALLVNQALKWHVGRAVAPCAALQQECYACILTFNYLKVNDCYLAWHTCQQFTLVLLKYLLCYSIKNESTEAKNENIPYHTTPLLPVACQLHKDLFTKRCQILIVFLG